MTNREAIADGANPLGLDGIEYIEYATSKPQALGQALEMMGFRPIARHRSREGAHSDQVAELVIRLDKLGYWGDYSVEVFNDDYQQMPMERVCARAFRAAEWLGEDALRRSAPLPNRMRLRS